MAARGARAQPAKLPTVGFLGATTPSAQKKWTDAFVQRLRELDWIEGRTIAIEYRWAEGRTDRAAEVFAEFVRLKVDVIVTHPTPLALAAKQATSLIPIVFAVAGDPVGTGLVASLARPGGNVTGLSLQITDTVSKRLELLREVVPGLRRLAMMANIGNPIAVLEKRDVQAVAATLGLEVATLEIRQAEDIAPAFEALKGRAEALYVGTDPLVNTQRVRINTLALNARLPSVCGFPEFVEAGGLISYGANFPLFSGGPPNLSIRFCAERSRRTFRSSSRQSSIWSSISRLPRRSASTCRHAPRPRRRGDRMSSAASSSRCLAARRLHGRSRRGRSSQ